jgi:hypothetical protein
MDAFLDEILVVLPVVGLNAFEKPQSAAAPHQKLRLKGKDASGIGYESDAGFVVLAGSEMRPDAVDSISSYMVPLRQNLLAKKVVAKVDGTLRFTQDYTFDSPSTAAGVLLGRSANGRIEWKEHGRTLKEIQTANLPAGKGAVAE